MIVAREPHTHVNASEQYREQGDARGIAGGLLELGRRLAPPIARQLATRRQSLATPSDRFASLNTATLTSSRTPKASTVPI